MSSLLGRLGLFVLVASAAVAAHAFDRELQTERGEVLRSDPATLRTAAGQRELTRDQSAWQSFLSQYGPAWRVRWNEATGTAHRIYGGSLAAQRFGKPAPVGPHDKDTILDLARAVVEAHTDLLGARWEDLRPVAAAFRGGRWCVTLQQFSHGREVVGARVDLRFSAAGDLFLLGADVYAVPAAGLPTLSAASVMAAARAGLPDAVAGSSAELVYLPMLPGEPLPPGARKARAPRDPRETSVRLAYRLRLRTTAPPGDWTTYVDAATGQVLWRTNAVRFAAATGTVTGEIHPALGTDPTVSVPFPAQRLFGGTTTGTVASYGFETGAAGWTAQAPWALSSESVHGGTQAWSDSPGVSYADDRNIALTSPLLNLSAVTDPVLEFWTRLELEETFDFLYVEASADGGSTWHTLLGLSDHAPWHLRSVDLAAVEGSSTVRVRFRLFTDGGVVDDGAWVDDVSIASRGSGVTNASGVYSLNTTGGSNAVTAILHGLYGTVFNLQGADATQTVTAVGGVANFSWTGANALASERDMYHAVNISHARIKQIDPAFTALDYPLPVFVDQPNLCNAYWDGSAVVFGAGATGCANLGTWLSVMYHEYGHGVTDFVYEPVSDPPGDMHECFSDYFMASIANDPRVGPDIVGPGAMFRTIQNRHREPQDRAGQVHHDGTILAGALWDMRTLLLPDVALADSLFHFARYGFPYNYEDYFLELLSVDDDDANLGNGTPHLEAIRSAFGNHGIGLGPELDHVAVTVEDAVTGNGDGRLDPGEEARLTVTLRNTGAAETGVYAKLSTTAAGVTVVGDSVFQGSFGAGAEITLGAAFSVQIGAGVAVGTPLLFDLELQSDVGFNGDGFVLPVGYVPILLVDDDRTRTYETWFIDSLTRLGKGFTRWVLPTLGGPTAEEMGAYRAVVWSAGVDGSTTLAPGDQAELATYLGAGGSLWVSGSNVAEDLWAGSSSVTPTAADISFHETWLHARVDMAGEGNPPPSVTGVMGDPIGDGIAFALTGGDGANNQTSASSLLLQPGAVAALRYANGRIAALRYATGHRLFYCGFGFEGVSTQAERDTVMARSLAWLCPAEATAPAVAVVQPNGGEMLIGQTLYTIRWTASDDVAVLAVNIHFSNDGGNSWTPVAAGVPNTLAYDWSVDDALSSGQCRIRVQAVDPSSNVGSDASDADFAITSTTDVALARPATFALHPAVPNPFNPRTLLRFDVPREGPVWLEILRVDGRRVRTLVDGEVCEPGRFERTWDGRDTGGRALASGVYVVRLRAAGFQETHKVQLLR